MKEWLHSILRDSQSRTMIEISLETKCNIWLNRTVRVSIGRSWGGEAGSSTLQVMQGHLSSVLNVTEEQRQTAVMLNQRLQTHSTPLCILHFKKFHLKA